MKKLIKKHENYGFLSLFNFFWSSKILNPYSIIFNTIISCRIESKSKFFYFFIKYIFFVIFTIHSRINTFFNSMSSTQKVF
ncbi:MAG: hypothetical protein EAZ59_29050 [Oscillatoriales cyanobacterium]|nr:MAG: hypothetical protein EAZ59_29050 [Oscillatoriales cyanobacterium]